MNEPLDNPIPQPEIPVNYLRSRRIGKIAAYIMMVAVGILLIAQWAGASLNTIYTLSLVAGFGVMLASFVSITASVLGIKSLIKKEKAPPFRYILLLLHLALASIVFILIALNFSDMQ